MISVVYASRYQLVFQLSALQAGMFQQTYISRVAAERLRAAAARAMRLECLLSFSTCEGAELCSDNSKARVHETTLVVAAK